MVLRCLQVLVALFAAAESTGSTPLDRTGRHPDRGRRSRVSEGVRHICVKFGGEDASDIHLRWDKDFNVGGVKTHVTAKTSWPRAKNFENGIGENGVLDLISLSGSVSDVVYEAHHCDGATDIALAYSLPGGIQLMSDVNLHNSGASEVKSVSAFHTAGAVNVQPTWFPSTKRLRLALGRGMRRFSCPLSFTTEFQPSEGLADASYEVGLRQEVGPGRQLRARLLMPPERESQKLTCEYSDEHFDKAALWIANMGLPLGGGLVDKLAKADFTLRRSWQF